MTIVKDHFFSTVRIDIVYRNVALGGPRGLGGNFVDQLTVLKPGWQIMPLTHMPAP